MKKLFLSKNLEEKLSLQKIHIPFTIPEKVLLCWGSGESLHPPGITKTNSQRAIFVRVCCWWYVLFNPVSEAKLKPQVSEDLPHGVTFTVHPELPLGLHLNESTGLITGIPLEMRSAHVEMIDSSSEAGI